MATGVYHVSRGCLAALALCVMACVNVPTATEVLDTPLSLGESRVVSLTFMRMDVERYEQVIDKEKILQLPVDVREGLWLTNIDLTGRSGKPRLLDNALEKIRDMDPDAQELSGAERNMVRLLNMTPDTADLSGTALDELLSIAPKVGFAPEEVLADALGVGVEDPVIADWALSQALVEGVIGSHPNAHFRRGPVSDEYPTGWVPVPLGELPVTLEDAASDLKSLETRYGPYVADGVYHPGFIASISPSKLLDDDFKMVIRANANALPYKGVDLSNVTVGSVSALGKEETELFDFSDPQWLQIEGLAEKTIIEEMTFQILEHPEFLEGGDSPMPAPWGNGEVWLAPPWTLERLIVGASLAAFESHDYSQAYYLGDLESPLFELSVDQGWMSLTTKGDVASPPSPLYVWDLFGEVAQIRMHDGPDSMHPEIDPLPEGSANVSFVLKKVDAGIDRTQIVDAIRRNLQEDTSGLISAASVLLDQSFGAPDLFYYRPTPDAPPEVQGDWLYFINSDDIPPGSGREADDYLSPGFFADAALVNRVSTFQEVAGDTHHEKVRLSPGDVVYAADDMGWRYRIEALDKPSISRIELNIQRVQ